MNIGIVDVDGHNFPNFALMKISAWHKSQGDNVEIALPMFGNYDRVYQSKIFTFTPDEQTDWQCEVVKGGTGYDIHSRLPEEIEECMDVLVNHVEEYGLWYELDVMFDPFGNGCDFFFAPDVMFHFSADEYEAFYARISNAIKKFHEQFNETPRL